MKSLYNSLVNALAPYSQLLFIILAILFVIMISQLFLAKYFPKFIGYWRNIPYFSIWAYRIVHSRLIKYPIVLAIVYSVMPLYPKEYWFIFRKAPYFWHLKKLFSKLDDIVDNASPEMIAAFGDASLGVNLNHFLRKLLDQDDVSLLNEFIKQKLINKKDLYAFCNLLANKLALEARLTLRYSFKPNLKLREKIAKNNVEISGAYLALIMHFIKKNPKVTELIERNKGLTYSALMLIYPKATQGGELIQIAHDITDFRYDLIQQPKIGKICANIFLAKMASHDNVVQFILNLPPRPVGFFELSEPIRVQLSLMASNLKINAFKINKVCGLFFTLYWEYIKRAGFTADKLKYQKSNQNQVTQYNFNSRHHNGRYR